MQTSKRRWTVWVALLTLLGLIAAACGDDGSGDDSQAGEGETTATSEPAPTIDDEEPESEVPQDSEVPEQIVLTDSFRGVTAETITLGYSAIDFELLNNTFGLDLAFQNFGPQADAIVDWYNDNGGVLGRSIELVHETYLPVGPTSADEACSKLTENAGVFAVLGGFNGPGAADVNDCFSKLHDTILVGPPPDADQAERAGGLWISHEMGLDRRNRAVAQLMADAGVLTDLGAMMVIGANPDEQSLVDGMAVALADVGVDVPITDVVTTTGDRLATAADVGIWIEQARIAGVSTVVMLGEGEFRNQEFFLQAPQFTYIMGNGDSITDWQSIPPEGLQPGTRVLTNNNGNDVDVIRDPAIAQCVDIVEEAQGIDVIPTSQLSDGEPNYFSGTIGVCRNVALFVRIAEAAGPDLTNESWIAALDEVPDLTLPGYDFVSLSSTKVDARDQLVLIEFDLETLTFEPISDPINVG